jgi:hypothetical protein
VDYTLEEWKVVSVGELWQAFRPNHRVNFFLSADHRLGMHDKSKYHSAYASRSLENEVSIKRTADALSADTHRVCTSSEEGTGCKFDILQRLWSGATVFF